MTEKQSQEALSEIADFASLDTLPLLSDRTKALYQDYLKNAPADIRRVKDLSTKRLIESGIGEKCLRKGDSIPLFSLPNAQGEMIDIADLLEKGPLVISFYRGSWCAFCNLELAALQQAYPYLKALNTSLVAISPELPEGAQDIIETLDLGFDILSDKGNMVAKQFGLSYPFDPVLRPIYCDVFKIDIPKANGDDSYELPVTATYLVAQDRTILLSDTNPDHTFRLEPRTIIETLRELQPAI